MVLKFSTLHEFTFQREQKAIVSKGSLIWLTRMEGGAGGSKGTILHEFPLSLIPNKVVKGLKVNGRDEVTETHNSN